MMSYIRSVFCLCIIGSLGVIVTGSNVTTTPAHITEHTAVITTSLPVTTLTPEQGGLVGRAVDDTVNYQCYDCSLLICVTKNLLLPIQCRPLIQIQIFYWFKHNYNNWQRPSCNNVAPVTNLCLGGATKQSHSSQWSKK